MYQIYCLSIPFKNSFSKQLLIHILHINPLLRFVTIFFLFFTDNRKRYLPNCNHKFILNGSLKRGGSNVGLYEVGTCCLIELYMLLCMSVGKYVYLN